MVDRVYLSVPENELVADILRRGFQTKSDKWVSARMGLARSLQEADAPDMARFKRVPQQASGATLHANQLTGEGRPGDFDFTDVYRAILSIYHNVSLFENDELFHDVLQRHIRRGLETINKEWQRDGDFNQYLLQQLFSGAHGVSATEDTDPEMPNRVERVLGQLGVAAKIVDTIDGPRMTRFTLELNDLDDLDRLRKGLTKISFALGFGEDNVSMMLAAAERRVFLNVPRPPAQWRVVSWSEASQALDGDAARKMALPLCLGTDILGEPFVIELVEAPHLFIGGTTGSGKSMCLHAILLSLLRNPAQPQMVLIDPKAVEFSSYAGARNLRGDVITGSEQALDVLNGLVEEMERRQVEMRQLDARNLAEAVANGANMPRIVVVIDELGDLMMSRREAEVPLIRLAQKARSSGIHLVLATQRPEAATFPGLLRSNIPSRIALTVQKSAESRIILDETGAESLLMRGDMLVRFAGRPTTRAHGCRIDQSDVIAAVRNS
ncbi:cell division protein FtsK [Sinorhizobium fredii]|uniref:Cell division protein FtsK n=1 Tax=Rhizobium fredii TaxID=380 RepID=A0A2A6LNP4_RHIFR|nr:FtsK/SpoIIIE domain-containing protein [Sinorhizobium fredii]PDT43975.1 cell division protein FtsK [Sinorhizobium fredii]